MRWSRALCVAVSLLGAASTARAQAPGPAETKLGAGQQAAAEDLFQQALTLAQEEKWAEAAAKLEESNRLERAPGTTLSLAECYVHLGKLASAWSLFEEAAAIFGRRSPPDARAPVAKEKAAALYPKLPRLTIDVPPGARVPGLVVKRDGAEVGEAQWGTGVAVDPGAHVLEATAPSKRGWRTTVDVQGEGEGAQVSALVPTLEDDQPSPPDGRSYLPAYVLGGLGVAAAIAGAAMVGVAAGVAPDIKSKQPDPPCQRSSRPGEDAICADLRAQAQSGSAMGNAGIGLIVGGGVLIAAGVLWIALPSKKAANTKASHVLPVVGQDCGGVVLTGSF